MRRRLSGFERDHLLSLLAKTRPAELDEMHGLAEGLRKGTGRAIFRYLGKEPKEEVDAALQVLRL